MNGHNLTRTQGTTRSILALFASSAILTAGCANMVSTAPSSSALNTGGQVTGKVHGGNQPVANATVTINFAGESGLRSPSTVAATTTTATDGTGSFAFTVDPVNGNSHPASGSTFACPIAGDPIVYVVSRGGNTLNNGNPSLNNTAAVFLSPIGPCSSLTSGTAPFLNLSEVTTVASIAALQQYFDPITESIGHDGIGAAKQALTNSVALVSNLVDLTQGTALPSVSHTGATTGDGVAAVTVTATPEIAKINHIANIISSCVNNGSAGAPNCNTLFANATPPDPTVTARPSSYVFPVATDVLQAAFYILTNPTNGSTTNLTNLYNLSPAVGAPYNPALTTAPSDWTIAVNYATTSTCGTGGGFINSPKDINVDFNGAIWFANGQAGTGNLAGISSNGTPLSCVFLSGGSTGGGVLDDQGKVWFGGTANNLYRYDPIAHSTLTFPSTDAPQAIVADGNHNVYFSTASTGKLFMIPAASTASAAVAPVQISSLVGDATRLFVDNSAAGGGAIWASSQSSNMFSRVAPATSQSSNLLNGYATTLFQTPFPVNYGIAVDLVTGTSPTNNVYVSGISDAIAKFNGSGTNYTLVSGWPTTPGTAGLNAPTSIVLDGSVLGAPTNIWSVNNSSNTTSGFFSISEIGPTGGALSPSGTTNGGFQKPAPYLGRGLALAIDQSGNLWVANDSSTSVTEIIGSAVPLYQPYAIGLMNGRFQQVP